MRMLLILSSCSVDHDACEFLGRWVHLFTHSFLPSLTNFYGVCLSLCWTLGLQIGMILRSYLWELSLGERWMYRYFEIWPCSWIIEVCRLVCMKCTERGTYLYRRWPVWAEPGPLWWGEKQKVQQELSKAVKAQSVEGFARQEGT